MTDDITSRIWRHRYALALPALAFLAAVVGTLVVLAPDELPVGLVWMTGDSMGVSQPVLAIYGPVSPSPGEFVVFHSETGWIGHRLVERTGEGWLTQGDAVPHIDQAGPDAITPVSNDQIAGSVLVSIPLSTLVQALAALLIGIIAASTLILSRCRQVSIPRPSLRGIATVTIAMLLVLSAAPLAPFLSGPVGVASADVVNCQDDFEEGTLGSNWTTYTGSGGSVTVEPESIEENYSMYVSGDAGAYNGIQDLQNGSEITLTMVMRNTERGANAGLHNGGSPDNSGGSLVDLGGGISSTDVFIRVNGDIHLVTSNNLSDWYKYELTTTPGQSGVDATVTNLNTSTEVYNQTISDTASMGAGNTSFYADGSSDTNGGTDLRVDSLSVSGQGCGGVAVSGTVTDDSGTTIENADITIENASDGSQLGTDTTNASGGYKVTGISDGNVKIIANADGYQKKSTTKSVSGSPVTVDFNLTGSTTGTVVDENGDPVAGATVKTIGYDFTNLTGTISEKRAQAQDIRDQSFDVTPPDFEQDPDLLDQFESADKYAVVHTYEDYDAGSEPRLNDPSTLAPENPDLRPPPVTIEAGSTLTVTLRESGSPIGQDEIDQQLPGVTTSGEVVVERVDSAGEPIDRTTAPTRDTFETGLLTIGGKTHETVTIADAPAGFYKVYPKGNPGAAYTVAVVPEGGLNELKTQVRTSLERQADAQADELAAEAQRLADEQSAGNITFRTTTTDANGNFALALNSSTLKEATVIAYKGPDTSQLADNASRQEIRDYYRDQVASVKDANLSNVFGRSTLAEACGDTVDSLPAYYRPAEQETFSTPADVEVTVKQVGQPEAVDLAARQCQRFRALNELRNTSLANAIPNLAGKLENASPEALERILENARSNAFQNSETCAEASRLAFGEVAPACNVDNEEGPNPADSDGDGKPELDNPTNTGPDEIPAPTVNVDVGTGGLTKGEARTIIESAMQADDSVGDTTTTDPPQVDTTNETVSVNFPVDADLSNESGITIEGRYSNGTEFVLDQSSQYVSVDSNALGSDVVRITDYPLGDAAAVNFQLDVATAEETASSTASATNPGFTGTIPDLGHLRVSSSQPGVGDTVVVEPGPAPQSAASFGGLVDAQAYAPNGTALNTTVTSDGEAEFTVSDPGRHRVDLTLQNPGGDNFTETTVVTAGSDTTDRPPTLRAQTGPLGQYAVASDGLDRGTMQVGRAGQEVTADAVLPANADPPSQLHVHEQGLDVQPSHTTQVRLLRGPNREQVRSRPTVYLHTTQLTEDALIYRNGEPAVLGTGESERVRVTRSNGSWTIQTPTTDDGTVAIRTVNDPGFVQRTLFRVRTNIPDLPIIGWALVPSPGLAALLVVGIGRRRRPPRGGAGGNGGVEA